MASKKITPTQKIDAELRLKLAKIDLKAATTPAQERKAIERVNKALAALGKPQEQIQPKATKAPKAKPKAAKPPKTTPKPPKTAVIQAPTPKIEPKPEVLDDYELELKEIIERAPGWAPEATDELRRYKRKGEPTLYLLKVRFTLKFEYGLPKKYDDMLINTLPLVISRVQSYDAETLDEYSVTPLRDSNDEVRTKTTKTGWLRNGEVHELKTGKIITPVRAPKIDDQARDEYFEHLKKTKSAAAAAKWYRRRFRDDETKTALDFYKSQHRDEVH